jgi:four helix bundle protein
VVSEEKWSVVSGQEADRSMTVKHYSELIAWQKAMDLVVQVYHSTDHFPQREVFGLTNQMRRAVVSIPSNIAEGQGRATTKDFRRFLAVARGSLQELETQILIAHRLAYLDEQTRTHLLDATREVARIINGLTNALAD